MVSLRISDSLDVLSKFRRGIKACQHRNSIVHHSTYTDITGQIILRLIQAFGACCLGFACLVSLPLVRGDRNDSTCPHRIGYIRCHVHSVCRTWPEDGSFGGAKEAEQALHFKIYS
jgi:hypothetical protein